MNVDYLKHIVDYSKACIQNIPADIYQSFNIEVDVLRIDAIDEVISGNKWFKLKYYLQQAIDQNADTLVTFGGAWSNHIVAVAAATKKTGIKSIGIIRGEEPKIFSNTLQQAVSLGMQLYFISREAYAYKENIDLNKFTSSANTVVVPEGGYGITGANGAAEILNLCDKEKYTHIICAVGTGTMLAGLTIEALPQQKILGICVLKGEDFLTASINKILPIHHNAFMLSFDYHFGGYAKKTNELIAFMNQWYQLTCIPSDFVYTAKLFFGVDDLIRKKYFSPGGRLLLIHSGGLQGNRSLTKGILNF